MLGRTTWGKSPALIFENFEIAQVKRGQFQIFKNHECDLSQMLSHDYWLITPNQQKICFEIISEQRTITNQ